MAGVSYASASLLGVFLECVMYGEHQVPSLCGYNPYVVLDRLCRDLCSFLYRCLLCPVGEVLGEERDQPFHGVRHRLLRAHRYLRKQGTTTPNNSRRNSPSGVPCPVELCHLALSGSTCDLAPLGSENPPWSAIPHRVDCLVCGTLSPSRGRGRDNSTPSTPIPATAGGH